MMRIVFWGDSHIPYRAERLPISFIEFLKEKKPDIMVVTGDLVIYSVLESVRKFVAEIFAVRGNMDEGRAAKLPIVVDFEVEGLKFSVFHGHGIYPRGDPQQLYHIAKKRAAKFLITGHTHSPAITEFKDIVILNPGSVCGVWGGGGGYGLPTWGEIIVDNNKCHVVIYEFTEGAVSIYEQRCFQL